VTVVDVDDGQLVDLRTDASTAVTRLREEVPYVVPDNRIQEEISTAQRIAAVVGTVNVGLLNRSQEILEQSLAQIQIAEETEAEGRNQVDRIEDLLSQADAANNIGNIDDASELLATAKRLFGATEPTDPTAPTEPDVGEIFEVSLENWYRPEVEEFWRQESTRLANLIDGAEIRIVFNRVDQMIETAQPLVQGRDFADALDILESAQQIWDENFPTRSNAALTALLRRARTGFSQESARVLREDLPGYSRLSQILNTAYGAFDDRSYQTAEDALELFFTEQPLNFQARLLEVRLALANAEDEPDDVVTDLVQSAIEEAGVSRAALRSGNVSDGSVGNLLELESKLVAILEVIEDNPGVTQAPRDDINQILAQVDRIVRPPLPPPPPGIPEANARIARADAFGDWADLAPNQLNAVVNLLTQALNIVPGYSPAIERYQFAISLPGAPAPVRVPPAGQTVMQNANELIAQGNIDQAVSVMEQYIGQNPNAPMDPEFEDLYFRLKQAQLGG
jgi:tetratricopeptide (TPR) repeat protein